MDRTAEFKELVQAKEQAYPPNKRQRVKFGHLRQGPDAPKLDPWTRQADQVVSPCLHSLETRANRAL